MYICFLRFYGPLVEFSKWFVSNFVPFVSKSYTDSEIISVFVWRLTLFFEDIEEKYLVEADNFALYTISSDE